MALKLITPATALALSVDDAKLQARIDDSVLDTRLQAYILAATEMAEQHLGRAIMPQTWELTLDAFPDAFELTRVPVSAVSSVKYYDLDGVQQTLSSSLYTFDSADDYGSAYVVPAYGTTWPSTKDQINAVAVRYVAGYAAAANVPPAITAWIALMVAAMVDNPSLEQSKQTYSLGYADRLLDRYKVWHA